MPTKNCSTISPIAACYLPCAGKFLSFFVSLLHVKVLLFESFEELLLSCIMIRGITIIKISLSLIDESLFLYYFLDSD